VGEVIFTFDPDEAGQKAASRAFAEEQRFAAQTFVAVGPEGLDPCDLRLNRGDEAVRSLISTRKPMFEFMIRRRLAGHDLETVEGRVAALRASAPVVARIRDRAMALGYTRTLAGWLGMDPAEVTAAVRRAASTARPAEPSARPQQRAEEEPASAPRGDERPGISLLDLPADPITRSERDVLMAIIQYPEAVGRALVERATQARFVNQTLAVVRDGIAASLEAFGTGTWVSRISDEVPPSFASFVEQLAIAPVPEGWRFRVGSNRVERTPEQIGIYCATVVRDLVDRDLLRQKSELVGALQRANAEGDQERYRELNRRSAELEALRRQLREE
jgi:DNA primase